MARPMYSSVMGWMVSLTTTLSTSAVAAEERSASTIKRRKGTRRVVVFFMSVEISHQSRVEHCPQRYCCPNRPWKQQDELLIDCRVAPLTECSSTLDGAPPKLSLGGGDCLRWLVERIAVGGTEEGAVWRPFDSAQGNLPEDKVYGTQPVALKPAP